MKRKTFIAGLLIIGISLLLTSISAYLWPSLLEQPAGLFGLFITVFLAVAGLVGGTFREWAENIFGKKEKPTAIKRQIGVGDNTTNVITDRFVQNIFETSPEQHVSAVALFTIPSPVQDFTGREEELKQLISKFDRGVVITGISGGGGVGKTELARKLADELKDDYPDARLNIDLRGTSDTPLSVEECMRRLLEPLYLNQKLPDDFNQLKGLYQQTLSTRKVLLLLDNAANANQVRSLVPSSPSVAIVTSRQYFSLTEFGLKEPLRLDVLSREEARELLRNASNKVNEFTDSEVDKLSEICGYLPLALRVSVSLLNDRPDWTLDILLQRLEDERTRLQRLKRPDDPNYDVEAAISLSYNLLPDKIQQRFRMLGIFSGLFWANPVAEVWRDYNSEDVDTCLGVLLTRSLLNSQSGPFSVLGNDDTKIMSYYTFHDLTHLFALDRLSENREEFAVAVEGHAIFFLQLAIKLSEEYRKGHDHMAKAVRAFHAIWYDLFTAWYRIQSNQNDWPRPEQADIWISTFPNMCADLLMLLVRPTDRIKIIEPSLECARRLGDKEHEGVNLSNLGITYFQLGEIEKAVELQQEAISICSELDNPEYKTNAILSLGTTYITLNKLDQAIELYEQALAIYDEIGDQLGQASIFANLGSIYSQLGKVPEAKELYEKGLLISQEIGNRDLEAACLNNLGQVYTGLNELEKAISFLEKALKITEELHDKLGQGKVLGSMGIAFARLGEASKALEFFEKQLETTHQTGDRLERAHALINIGTTYAKLGDQRKTLEFFEESLLIQHEIGNQIDEARTLEQIGVTYWQLGDKGNAKIFLRKALLIFTTFEDPRAQKIQKWLNDLESINVQDFIRGAIEAARTKKPEAAEYFEAASNMGRDQSISEELQEVGKVLREYLAGVKNPDLSRLREDFAQLIKDELEKSKDDIV